MTKPKMILLVEDNPDDEELALLALNKGQVANEVVVVRDGAEALDYLYATGTYAARDPAVLPQMVLLDLKLPKVDGLEVLQKLRSGSRTRRLPVVILTSSREDEDSHAELRFGSQLLYSQARGLPTICRSREPTSVVLAGPQRTPAPVA